jgi:hypothetical protein
MKMKKQAMMFIVVLFELSVYSQTTEANQIGGQGSSTYKFKVNNPTHSWGTNSPVQAVSYFWYFGDGEWSTEESPTHTYYTGSTIAGPYVEVTPIRGYTGTEAPHRINVPSNGTTLNITPTLSKPTGGLPNVRLSLSTNRLLVSGPNGHRVTYIISYKNNGCEPSTIKFQYPNTLLEPELFSPSTLMALPQSSNPTTISNGIDQIEWNISSQTSDNNYRHILIRMKVKNNINAGVIVSTKVQFSNGCAPDYVDNQEIRKSHDPNLIVGDVSYDCMKNAVDKIKYKIRFQNIGIGKANTVLIKNFIPEIFDLASLTVLPPSNGSAMPVQTPLSPSNYRKAIVWNLQGNALKNSLGLRGTNEEGIGQSFLLEDTYDYLTYEISLKRNTVDCDAIVNKAWIKFDEHEPIWTAPFVTNFGCKSQPSVRCDTCSVEFINESPTGFDYLGNPVTLEFDTDLLLPSQGYTYQWYPLYGLDNPNSPNPTAHPCYDMDYYLVASANPPNCHKIISHCYVHVIGNPCSRIRKWPWLLAGTAFVTLLGGYIIWNYIRKK